MCLVQLAGWATVTALSVHLVSFSVRYEAVHEFCAYALLYYAAMPRHQHSVQQTSWSLHAAALGLENKFSSKPVQLCFICLSCCNNGVGRKDAARSPSHQARHCTCHFDPSWSPAHGLFHSCGCIGFCAISLCVCMKNHLTRLHQLGSSLDRTCKSRILAFTGCWLLTGVQCTQRPA